MAINFNVIEQHENFQLIRFAATDVQPREIAHLDYPEPQLGKGLVFSGAGPQWLISNLVAHYKNEFPFLALFDPKLQKAIVVVSFQARFPVGGEIEI